MYYIIHLNLQAVFCQVLHAICMEEWISNRHSLIAQGNTNHAILLTSGFLVMT